MTDRAPLPLAGRVLLGGSFVEAFGTGLTFPFLLVYLHLVRGIPLSTTGLLLAIPGLVGFVVGPISGSLTDRVGPRRTLIAGLLASTVGTGLLTVVHHPPLAAPALLLMGAGQATFFATQNTLFGRIAEGPVLQRMYATHFVLLNAGIGVGGLVGGLVADVHHPHTFVGLYLFDAVSFVLYAGVVGAVRIHGPAVHEDAATGSYAEVLRNPMFRWVMALSVLLAVCGYAAIDSGLPAMATVTLGLQPRAIASGLVANTAMIVIGQFLVLRSVERMRRTRAICWVAAIWAGAWLLLGLAGVVGPHPVRFAMVVAFGAIFGLGETFMAPTISPMTAAIAPGHLQGRFFALTSLSYSFAFTIGPPIATTLVGHHLAGVWIGLMITGCASVAALALRLRGRLTPEQDGALPLPDPELALTRGA